MLAGSNKSTSAVIKKKKKTNKKLKRIRSPSKSPAGDASKMSQRLQQLHRQKTKKKQTKQQQAKSLGQGAHGEQASGRQGELCSCVSLEFTVAFVGIEWF